MNKSQQLYAVTAICLSIIMAGAIIAYRPGVVAPVETTTGSTDLRYPGGVGTSMGIEAVTYADENGQAKTISLSGSGSAAAQADQASVSMGVEVTDESAADAIGENAALMSAVIEAVKAQGVSEDDIYTTSYSVYAQYDWTEKGREFEGYTVTNLVRVTVKDLDKVGDVIDAAGAAGANRMDGISFELSAAKREELKTNAYVAALQDAEGKAELITETLGLTITGVQSVSESSYVPARTYQAAEMSYAMEDGGYAPTPIVSGELTVSVSVYIVYLFE
ncbi:SIMPL domain-containing protein [Candidatus Bathyarchaeota archaeon]|nr:SIMPL domain-containing protein [Candidatus Bathyarchaeota archaeon]